MKRIKRTTYRITSLSLLLGLSLSLLFLILARPRGVRAATITVTSTADAGGSCPGASCTLRQAIATAASGDTIDFAAGLTSITLTSAELLINKNLTISGPGANTLTVQRSTAGGTPDFRIFHIASGAFNVTISGLTISNGNTTVDSGGIFTESTSMVNVADSTVSGNTGNAGGGIQTGVNSPLTLTNSTVSGNSAFLGGGIFNNNTVSLTNSTVSGNTSGNSGGGIFNNGGTLTLTNSTVSGNIAGVNGGGINTGQGTINLTNSTVSNNTSTGIGGGINSNSGTENIKNTIIAGNTGVASAPDLAGTGSFTSQGYNLIGKSDGSQGFTNNVNNDQVGSSATPLDPKLDALGNYGGPTQTHNLLFGSPAIDKGSAVMGITTDQRGKTRPFDNPSIAPASGGDNSDIGAVELQYVPTAANGNVGGQITDASGAPISGVAITLSGTQSREAITDSNGDYRFDNVETNGFYTVVPTRANFTFSPANRSFSLLGVQTEASFTATANGDQANAIDTIEFFVRQHYLDFLGREPDPPGFIGWVNTIRNCAAGDPSCDRVHVSEAFFRSAEFQERGYFVYRFYATALGRKPDFAEFAPDLARVSGFLTDDQLAAAKAQFANDFTSRAAFINQYATLSNAQYVDALSQTAGVTLSNRQALVESLNAGTLTRAQALRQIAESGEVYQRYYNQAFVVMEYFGYLRRDPDALYLNWIQVLDANSADSRRMVEGFVDATEYRNRFRQ